MNNNVSVETIPLAYPPEAAARRIGIGRTKLFLLIRDKRIQAVKFGKRTLITEEALRDFLKSLPAAN